MRIANTMNGILARMKNRASAVVFRTWREHAAELGQAAFAMNGALNRLRNQQVAGVSDSICP